MLLKREEQTGLPPAAQVPESVHYSLPIISLCIFPLPTTPYHSILNNCNFFASQVALHFFLIDPSINYFYLLVFEVLP